MHLRSFAIVAAFLGFVSGMQAQDLEVESFKEKSTLQAAGYTSGRSDLNGDPCAVIRVDLDEEDVRFSGSIVGKPKRTSDGYLVYVPQGTKKIKISPLEYLPLEVNFTELGVAKTKGGYLYDLTFKSPAVGEGVTTIGITSRPPSATIYLDGVEKGNAPLLLSDVPAGKHKLKVTAEGYEEYSKTEILQPGISKDIMVSLKKEMPITIRSNVKDFTLSVDDEPVADHDKLVLSEGDHLLSVEAKGFKTQSRKVKISAESDNTFIFNLYSTIIANGVEYRLVYIPETKLKSKDKEIELQAFRIGETEVTQQFWEAVMGSNPSIETNPKFPVTNVSWSDCQEFLKKLKELTGRTFSLPTESEWEYAACGGPWKKKKTNAKSYNLDEEAWYAKNSNRELHKVAQKKPNLCGLYDMLGNVSEWCNDKSDEQTTAGQAFFCRGGDRNDEAYYCTPYFRSSNDSNYRGRVVGFRIVMH